MAVFRGLLVESSVDSLVEGGSQDDPHSRSEGSPVSHVAPPEISDTHSSPQQQSLAEPAVPALPRHASRKRQQISVRTHGHAKKPLPGPSAPHKRRPLQQAGPTATKRSGSSVNEQGVDTAKPQNVFQQKEPSTSSHPNVATDEQHHRFKLRKRKHRGNGDPPSRKPRTASLQMPPRHNSRPPFPHHSSSSPPVPVPDPAVQRSSTHPGSPQPSSSRQRATTSPGRHPQAGPSSPPKGVRTSTSSRSSSGPQHDVATPHRQRFQYARSSPDWRNWCDHVQKVLLR